MTNFKINFSPKKRLIEKIYPNIVENTNTNKSLQILENRQKQCPIYYPFSFTNIFK